MLWISLVDYSARSGVSLSTLRRHIKSNRIVYRKLDGKYLLQWEGSHKNEGEKKAASNDLGIWNQAVLHARVEKIEKLERDLRLAREEIAELKTLVACYEEDQLQIRVLK